MKTCSQSYWLYVDKIWWIKNNIIKKWNNLQCKLPVDIFFIYSCVMIWDNLEERFKREIFEHLHSNEWTAFEPCNIYKYRIFFFLKMCYLIFLDREHSHIFWGFLLKKCFCCKCSHIHDWIVRSMISLGLWT